MITEPRKSSVSLIFVTTSPVASTMSKLGCLCVKGARRVNSKLKLDSVCKELSCGKLIFGWEVMELLCLNANVRGTLFRNFRKQH